MSKVIKRILPLFLALALSLVFVGCGDGGTGGGGTIPTGGGVTPTGGGEEELTQTEIEEILTRSASATAAADTYKFEVQMSVGVEAQGGSGAGEAAISSNSTGIIDNVDEEMQISMDISMETPDGGQDISMELYFVGEWMYLKMGMPGVGDEWMKEPVDTALMGSMDQVAQQLALLQAAANVRLLGRESVRGVDCYVIEVEPSADALASYLSQSGTPMESMDMSELAYLFEDMAVRYWIGEDDYLLRKSTMDMHLDASAADMGASEEDFERMVMDLNTEFEAYDYNEPVSIEVPEEALGA